MRRLGWIVAGLVLVAVLEIAVLILVGRAIGTGWTLLLVLASSMAGVWLLRREGARSWRLFADELRAGRPPGNAATEGLLAVAGGVLLVVPGLLTDLVAAVLLLPPTRRATRAVLLGRFGDRLSPDVSNSLFGPRRVRARAGRPQRSDAPVPPSVTTRPGSPQQPSPQQPSPWPTGGSDGIVEGEIIDPR